MSGKNNQEATNQLVDTVTNGLLKMKAEKIVEIDLNLIEGAECERFIVCHGNSNTHVSAIARCVEEVVREEQGHSVWHSDGYQNGEWILLDYINVMVHVFRKEYRQYYDIEQLWADATITKIEQEN